MTRSIRTNWIWIAASVGLIGVCSLVLGLQRIYAQQQPVETPPPNVAGNAAPGATPATGSGTPAAQGAPAVAEPGISFSSAISGSVATSVRRSWDGKTFIMLKFRYKTVDDDTITVVMPAAYKNEQRSRSAWESLFVVYAMDREIAFDARERARPPDVSRFMAQFMSEFRGQTPDRAAPDVAAEAMDKARAYVPSMGAGSVNMPIMLPGMP